MGIDLEIGDAFSITVLGETLNYTIDNIDTVLPEEMDGLAIEEDKDYCTLVEVNVYLGDFNVGHDAVTGDVQQGPIPFRLILRRSKPSDTGLQVLIVFLCSVRQGREIVLIRLAGCWVHSRQLAFSISRMTHTRLNFQAVLNQP